MLASRSHFATFNDVYFLLRLFVRRRSFFSRTIKRSFTLARERPKGGRVWDVRSECDQKKGFKGRGGVEGIKYRKDIDLLVVGIV